MAPLPARLLRLPSAAHAIDGADVRVADSYRARLLGLAALPSIPADVGLLLPRCRSIHTFGMRFALDLQWLAEDGTIVRVDRAVPPNRIRGCRTAAAVIETRATLRRAE